MNRRCLLLSGILILLGAIGLWVAIRDQRNTRKLADGSLLTIIKLRSGASGTVYGGNFVRRIVGRFLPPTGIRLFGKSMTPLSFRYSNPESTNRIAFLLHHSNIPQWSTYKGIPRRTYIPPRRYFGVTDSNGNFLWTIGGSGSPQDFGTRVSWDRETVSLINFDVRPNFGETFGLVYYEKTNAGDIPIAEFKLHR